MGRDAAEDLAQETMLLLEEKYAAVQSMEELVPLSFRIVRFKMMSLRRRAARRGEGSQVSVDDLPLSDPAVNIAGDLERRELLERLERALAQVGDRCREMFRMKLDGKSFEEIRASMGVKSLNTIYTWDFRCRKRMQELMGVGHDAG